MDIRPRAGILWAMSPRQAAERTGRSPQTVMNWIHAGKLAYSTLKLPGGKTVYDIPASELKKLRKRGEW
jgi:predicted site-specific integrase-resolvase